MALISEEDVTFTPAEIEFLAGDELISIVPNFSLATEGSTLACLLGDYGPFNPNFPVDVPLWMALALHKRNKCRIQAPEWMSVQNLEEVLEQEERLQAVFQPLPMHYIEIAHLLLTHAKDTFSDGEDDTLTKTMSLVKEIREMRWKKIDSGLKILQGPMTVKLNNLSAMECNMIRAFFQGSLDQFYKLESMRRPADAGILSGAVEPNLSSQQPVARQLRRDAR